MMSGYRPQYNIAPDSEHPVVTNEAPDQLRGLTWGFRARGSGSLINARSETVGDRPAFADSWTSRPCLIPSSGFYEWQERGDGPKQPYRIYRPDDPAFSLAGIWEPGDPPRFTILTTEPAEDLARIHDRMPVILPRDREEEWLTGGQETRAHMCRPYPHDDLAITPISRRVNVPSNDDHAIIEPVDDPQTGLDSFA